MYSHPLSHCQRSGKMGFKFTYFHENYYSDDFGYGDKRFVDGVSQIGIGCGWECCFFHPTLCLMRVHENDGKCEKAATWLKAIWGRWNAFHLVDGPSSLSGMFVKSLKSFSHVRSTPPPPHTPLNVLPLTLKRFSILGVRVEHFEHISSYKLHQKQCKLH